MYGRNIRAGMVKLNNRSAKSSRDRRWHANGDIAFNNAGTLGEAGPSTNVSEAGWNDAIAINLTGSFLGAKHQIAEMLKHGGGSVIFTSVCGSGRPRVCARSSAVSCGDVAAWR